MAKLNNWFIIIFLCFFITISCQKQFVQPQEPQLVTVVDSFPQGAPQDTVSQGAKDSVYDIILLMGQSNTLAGNGFNSSLDCPDSRIEQLGRFFSENYKIIPATEPLQNSTPEKNCIGFAMTFAKLYADQKLENGRRVLIIPCGAISTGFLNNHWNRGNDLYKDAVNRTNFILKIFPGSRLKCFLWHQGEADVNFGAADYQTTLENMIYGLHHDIKAESVDSIPFIMGGLVPFWVNENKKFKHIDSALRNEPYRLPVAGFADPLKPFIITKPVDTVNAIHFDANGQREMGKRYFAEYLRLTK